MKKNIPPVKVVIVLVQHPVLGHELIPYTAQEEADNNIRLIEQAFHTSADILSGLSEAERNIIRIASAYTEKHLMSVYSTEKTVTDFLKKITEKQFKEIIRPFIEKKMLEMMEIIREYNLPFYENKAGNKILFPHHKYHTSPHFTELTYHFEADETSFHYLVSCYREGKPVSLSEHKPVITVISNPAVILLGQELHQFQNIHASRITPFTRKAKVSVSISLLEKYLDNVVLPIITYHNFTSENLPIVEETREPEFILSVDTDTVYQKPVLKVSYQYRNKTFFPGSKQTKTYAWIIRNDGSPTVYYFKRKLAKEQEIISKLQSLDLRLIDDCHLELRKESSFKDVTEWLLANKRSLSEHFRLMSKDTQADYYLERISVEEDLTETNDWFELHITVLIGDYQIPFIRFRRHIIEGKREYKLPDGKIVLLPEEWFSKYTDLLEYSEKDEERIKIKPEYIGIMQASLEKKDRITYRKKEETAPPPKLKATLRQYQKEGFNWMIHLQRHSFGGCLADDMGLGKTLQTLSVLQYTYDNNEKAEIEETDCDVRMEPVENGQLSLFDSFSEDNTTAKREENESVSLPEQKKPASLIVMPTSLLHNWRREIRKFTTLSVYEFGGTSVTNRLNIKATFDRFDLVITTYGMMRNNIEALSKYRFEYVVLDESQIIKNSDSLTFRSAIRLQSNYRLILTGTPIENSLKDLWSQFRFIQPGLLGTEKEFITQFINPIKQGNARIENKLQKLIYPFILRRSKQEVAPELPLLTEEIVYCEMSAPQKQIYEKEKNSLRNILLQFGSNKQKRADLNVLNGITRLRQLASHPQMISPDFTGTSGKLDEIITLFETLRSEGHKVLIFSSFVKHLEIIARAFEANGWEYAMLTGSSTDREGEIKRFTDSPTIQAFFISLKAGGVGLNLTCADYVFIVDPWWNPAAELQAISRAHRIGQDKNVFAYRFISEDTIEEKIVCLQESKRKLSETFIADNNPLLSLTDEEWEELIK